MHIKFRNIASLCQSILRLYIFLYTTAYHAIYIVIGECIHDVTDGLSSFTYIRTIIIYKSSLAIGHTQHGAPSSKITKMSGKNPGLHAASLDKGH